VKSLLAHENYAAEFNLALACAHWPLRDRDREEVLRLTEGRIDWDWFVRIIDRNQILPLAYRNLRDALPDCGHIEILDKLRRKMMALASHSLTHAAELIRVTESVENAGMEMVELKGASLSVLAYGNVSMRNSGDIDLLISPTHVFEVERVLLGLGYVRYEPRAELTPRRQKHYLKYYKHFAYVCEAKSVLLELHWRLHHCNPLTARDAAAPETVKVPVGSGIVSALARDDLFLYLCVHGSIHGWPILKWLADIGALLGAMTEEDLRRIVTLASRRGMMAELRAALILADSFLAVSRPSVELPREQYPLVDRIVGMAQRLLTAQDYCLGIQDIPSLQMFFYDLRMRSSWQYRSEDLRRALVFPDDWELVDLPDALFPLYAAVRPVSWLIRHLPRLLRRQPASVEHSSSTLSS
jgi:hypothetical protein